MNDNKISNKMLNTNGQEQLELIDKYISDIQNGTRDLLQFNQPEHAGVCSAGSLLIGALIVCDLARESLGASSDASGSETPPRMLNESLGTENPYLGMSWQELKSLGHGLRTSAL